MGLGTWIRNQTGLERGSPAAESLRAHGLDHPDDMSYVILEAYGLYLNERTVNLDSLVRSVPPSFWLQDHPAPGRTSG